MPELLRYRTRQAPVSSASGPRLRVHVQHIPGGDPGIRATALRMRDIIRRSIAHPIVREHARLAVVGVPSGDSMGEALAIRDHVGRVSQYRRDPLHAELLQEPAWVLTQVDHGEIAQLDCDDLTMLVLSLAGAVGIPGRIHVVSTRPDQEYNHVFALVRVKGAWWPLDMTRYWMPPDTPIPRITRYFDLEV